MGPQITFEFGIGSRNLEMIKQFLQLSSFITICQPLIVQFHKSFWDALLKSTVYFSNQAIWFSCIFCQISQVRTCFLPVLWEYRTVINSLHSGIHSFIMKKPSKKVICHIKILFLIHFNSTKFWIYCWNWYSCLPEAETNTEHWIEKCLNTCNLQRL